ncbi:NAD(P)H-hydrate epimerase [Trueperella pyogenes]|uniref:bifunctional ADP-dependent NAD(P)H-hydrate dehydratase/NAD(P)H-hydrate epimerase n=1 Tax=Trueperella pyogenes TaxID=1661 RepID=UPI003132A65C
MYRAFNATAVRGAEEPLLAAGEPLMERAAYAVAQAVIRTRPAPGARILALVGKGNNGGDALFAAAYLARRGFFVTAVFTDAHGGALAAAERSGVRLVNLPDADPSDLLSLARRAEVWIDGLLGIGARGGAREPYATWISALVQQRAAMPVAPVVVAVDVPSGVGVDDADLPGPFLPADLTVATGCLKPAHLLPPARYACGQVEVVELGIKPGEPPVACEVTDADVADLWHIPGREDHKYTRGVVGLVTGSREYPGAGVLSAAGALGGGPGMVRYLGTSPHVARAFPEVVPVTGRVQSWVVGSGLTDLDAAAGIVDQAISERLPIVLDAAAIRLVYGRALPESVVLTPHAGELADLLSAHGMAWDRARVESQPVVAATRAAQLTGATVAAKFATTLIAAPVGAVFAQGRGPGWTGTAGAGDVLAGLMGTILAAHADALREEPERSAVLAAAAVHIHQRAAAQAAGTLAGRVGQPITASDIARALPSTIGSILND